MLQNKQYVLFDLDGILLSPQFDNDFWQQIIPQAYAKLHSLTLEQAKSLVSTYEAAVYGTLDYYSIDYWHNLLGLNILGLSQQYAHLIKLNKHAEKFLFYLNNLEKRPKCYLISNEHPSILNYKLQLTGLDCFFDGVTSSHALGLPKQANKFWPKYFELLNIDPRLSILLDANYDVIKTVCDVGLDVISTNSTSNDRKYNHQKLQYIDNLAELMPQNLTNNHMIYAK